MSDIRILWVDDEIDVLKPHILFLEKRGYTVATATNADDALDMLEGGGFHLTFLDENMPGLSGLDALGHIKKLAPNMPVVMVTKSEEEDIMDRAVGAKIADYLIKPVNPNQILLSIKKNLHEKELVSAGTTSASQSDFAAISAKVDQAQTADDWANVYRQLSEWRLSLMDIDAPDMLEMHAMQQQSANAAFAKFIRRNYEGWFRGEGQKPLQSPNLLRDRVFPLLDAGERVLLIVVDNMRYDQWRIIREMLAPFYRIESEDLYYAILPTVTQYARNAIFAGLMPLEIEQLESDLWVGEGDEGAMNGFEHELLQRNIQRWGRSYKTSYYKGANLEGNPLLAGDYSQMLRDDLTVVVYNFVDMLSHARSDMRMVKQLAVDVHGYLSLTQSWFKHSDLFALLQRLVDQPIKVVITTDHGSIQVKRPTRVIGDRATTPNLRYKMGKNLNYQERDVYDTTRPASLHLPQLNVSSRYIFATGDYFFAYPNNYNQFVNMYRDSFQHGGVSLEEMIVPVVTMKGMQ